jgi:hypothetical protein
LTPLPAAPDDRRALYAFRALVAVAAFLGWLQFARLPIEEQVQFVPDDGFYYLNLASNFASKGIWSFDGGISRTTGFHLLHAHVAAVFAPLFSIERAHALLVFHAAIAYALTVAAASVLLELAMRLYGRGALVGVALVFAGGAALSIPRMMMEWPYAVLLHVLVLSAFLHRRHVLLGLASFLLPIARTDGIVPLFLTMGVFAAASFRKSRSIATLRREAIAGISSLFGLAVVSLFCFVHSGHWTQGNARMKAHWAEGPEPIPIGKVVGAFTRAFAPGFWSIETPSAVVLALYFVVLGGYVLVTLARRDRTAQGAPPSEEEGRTLLVAVAVACVGTLAVYAWKVNAFMPWYCAYFLAPVALFLGAGSARLGRARPWWIGVVAVSVEVALGLWMARLPLWPQQERAFAAAQWVRTHPEVTPAAAWNAGIGGYFSGSKVVNLDGLVNDDIHPYVFANEIHCYFLAAGIRTIVDQDCDGGPEETLVHRGAGPLHVATESVRDFGRVPRAPNCDIRAWRVDHAVLKASCPAVSAVP